MNAVDGMGSKEGTGGQMLKMKSEKTKNLGISIAIMLVLFCGFGILAYMERGYYACGGELPAAVAVGMCTYFLLGGEGCAA